MKISIITVVLNAENTIVDAVQSIASQSYKNVEHIIIDGQSTDRTLERLKPYAGHIAQLVSEPDDGLYHAMNKGIALAQGDIIGILNADDVYADNTVLQQVADAHADPNLDAVYADLVYVKNNDLSQVVRNWKSRDYIKGLSFDGWMPPHPTLFLKKQVYDRAGIFDTQLRYQSDLEFCTRLFEVHQISSLYVPNLWVRMRLGGVSNNSFLTMIKGNWESYQAMKKHGLKRNPVVYFLIKFASRIKQYF